MAKSNLLFELATKADFNTNDVNTIINYLSNVETQFIGINDYFEYILPYSTTKIPTKYTILTLFIERSGREHDIGPVNKIIEILLKYGFDPNLPCIRPCNFIKNLTFEEKEYPLTTAIRYQASNRVIELLLNHGAEPNFYGDMLNEAIINRSSGSTIALLLRAGAVLDNHLEKTVKQSLPSATNAIVKYIMTRKDANAFLEKHPKNRKIISNILAYNNLYEIPYTLFEIFLPPHGTIASFFKKAHFNYFRELIENNFINSDVSMFEKILHPIKNHQHKNRELFIKQRLGLFLDIIEEPFRRYREAIKSFVSICIINILIPKQENGHTKTIMELIVKDIAPKDNSTFNALLNIKSENISPDKSPFAIDSVHNMLYNVNGNNDYPVLKQALLIEFNYQLRELKNKTKDTHQR